LANGIIGFVWDAAQGGVFVWPYVNHIRVNENTGLLIDNPVIYSNSFAINFANTGANQNGEVAIGFFEMGGSKNPQFWIGVDTTTQGSQFDIQNVKTSSTGPSTTNQWGDYVRVKPQIPFNGQWLASGYTLQGGGAGSNVEILNVHFGVTVPSAITDLAATYGNTQVTLSWTAPNNGGSAITDYIIEYKLSSDASYTTFSDGTSTTAGATVTGLTNGLSYDFKVSAVNAIGTGTASNVASATPIPIPDPPTSLTATAVSQSQIDLSWTAPLGTIIGYKIERESPVDGGWKILVKSAKPTFTTYSNTKLKPNTEYNYRVSAIFASDTSDPSDESSTFTLPKAPTKLTAKVISSSQINLSWKVPTGSAAGYKIEQKTGTDPFATIVADTGNTLVTYSVTGLTEKTSYTYRVSAVNTVGSSIPSNSISATTETEPAENLLILEAIGTAKLSKSVTTGDNHFDTGTYDISILIFADNSVNGKGTPKLSNIEGTFDIDGENDSQDVTEQPFTNLKLTVSKDHKSIKWTAKEGKGEFKFATKVDFTGPIQEGSKSTISKIAIGKATFAPTVTDSSIELFS
jgi:hypothetical protein